MGMIGRWIDTLGERERDAIIQHPDPTYDGWGWWDDDLDCGCLVGCVMDVRHGGETPKNAVTYKALEDFHTWGGRGIPDGTEALRVGWRFPRISRRFTPERMWRAVKARAAKPHRVSLEAPAAVVSTEAA